MSTGLILLLTAAGWAASFAVWGYFDGRRVDAERTREWARREQEKWGKS